MLTISTADSRRISQKFAGPGVALQPRVMRRLAPNAASKTCDDDRFVVSASEHISRPEDIDPDLERSFGDHLKELRTRSFCKQLSLSAVIGCSEAAISLWETRARLPKARTLGRLLNELAKAGVPTVELLALRN